MGKRIVCLTAMTILLLGSGCSAGASTKDSSRTTAKDATPGTVKVTYFGEVISELDIAEIAKLPQMTVKVNDTVRTGPTLTAVVDLAGIKMFGGAMVCGYSRDHSTELSIELGEVDLVAEIILPLENGTVAIFGPNIAAQYWSMAISDLIITPGDCCAV
jgi:hypothetical protein